MRNFIYKISLFSQYIVVLGYSQNCGDHTENDYNAIFQKCMAKIQLGKPIV